MVAPLAGIAIVAEVVKTLPELYRSDAPTPVVPSNRAYSAGPAPLLQVKVTLVASVPDDGVNVAGTVVPGSVKV